MCWCSWAILGLLALVSNAEPWQSDRRGLITFAYQIARNLQTVSLGMILLLWVSIYVRDLPRGIAAHMVPVWGIYFLFISSTSFIFDFIHNLPPSAPRLHLEVSLMAQAGLPLGLSFAIVQSSGKHLSLKS